MRTTIITTTLLSLSLGTISLFAEEPPKPKPEGPRPGGGGFFREMDKDGDKAISKEEAGERWERLGKLDKDGDGKVTIQEMMAGRPEGGPRPAGSPGGDPAERFRQADKNGDGKLTEDEVPAELWARIGKGDTDKDGAISPEEAKAMRPEGGAGAPGGPGRPESDRGAMLRGADKDGDKAISQEEAGEHWERLSKLDKNSDGKVTFEEMMAARPEGGRLGGPGVGPGRPGAGGPEGPGAIFGKYDADKDGKLSKAEVPAEMWVRLSKADDDADGLVSKSELESVFKGNLMGPRPEGGKPRTEGDKPRPEGDKPRPEGPKPVAEAAI